MVRGVSGHTARDTESRTVQGVSTPIAIGRALRYLASRARMRQIEEQYTPAEIDLWGRVLTQAVDNWGIEKAVKAADTAIRERRIRERVREHTQQKQGPFR